MSKVAAALLALSVTMPTAALASSGIITCAVDSFDKDGATAKQQLTVTFDGSGASGKATLQSPWGTLVYDDAVITGDDTNVGIMVGGERDAKLPDFAGMEACLSKSTPDQLHDFATLLGLVADCGHGLALGSDMPAQTLFGFAAKGNDAQLSMSISYSQDSTVAQDYLEFRQSAACKRVM
ncbi:MAG TPA: hypothetical protein VHA70_09325 [Bauldia sp.]|nr:hypothetical protein [Bauldia sp.]